MKDQQELLKIESLKTVFPRQPGFLNAVNEVDLSVHSGETVAVVGESGSGKTMMALSILRLVPPPGRIVAGQIKFCGFDLLNCSEREMASIRGRNIGLILQDALSALNPVIRVGEQIAEVFRHLFTMNRKQARFAALQMMERVQLSTVENLYRAYPHQLSGGQRQRVLIAIALAGKPKLVIADEPTTALDVSIQSQILLLLQELKDALNLSLVLITHDLGVVGQIADRVAVMYAGRIVEEGATQAVFANPLHPYTEALLEAVPRIDGGRSNPKARSIKGGPPDPMNLPSGCAFHPRCFYAEPVCSVSMLQDTVIDGNRRVKCLKMEKNHVQTPNKTLVC